MVSWLPPGRLPARLRAARLCELQTYRVGTNLLQGLTKSMSAVFRIVAQGSSRLCAARVPTMVKAMKKTKKEKTPRFGPLAVAKDEEPQRKERGVSRLACDWSSFVCVGPTDPPPLPRILQGPGRRQGAPDPVPDPIPTSISIVYRSRDKVAFAK